MSHTLSFKQILSYLDFDSVLLVFGQIWVSVIWKTK